MEPTIVSGSTKIKNTGKNGPSKLDELRIEVEQTAQIMKTAMIKAYERDVLLNQFEERSEQLTNASNQFAKTSRSTKRAMCWRHFKMQAILYGGIICVLIIVICIAVPSITYGRGGGGSTGEEKVKSSTAQ